MRGRQHKNPYVFVVGCLRSGTTLLQRMLDSHPQLAVCYDSHFIPRGLKGLAVGVDPPLTPELVERVRSHPRFARLGLPDAATREAAANAATYREYVSALYSQYGRLRGKPLAGEKSPGYCRHLPHLHGLFPWAKTIHIVRDGRDVALSVLDWAKGPAKLELFQDEPAAACALWWRRDVETGRADGADLGRARYREVRYERLVARPEGALRELAEFLDLPFAREMLDFHEGKTRSKPGRSAKAAWLPPTPGLRDWRTQMAERDLELFEAVAGDLLSALGYERAFETISPEIAAVAARCERWWRSNGAPQRRRARHAQGAVSQIRHPASQRPHRNPYVFIVGCPRSGTTLLKRMVDAHPQIAITPETHWIPRFFRKRVGLTRAGLVTPALTAELLAYPKFPNLKIGGEELGELTSSGKPISYADFVSGVFDLYGARRGKQLVGDKTPGYVQDLPLLHALWPEARFVHLIRDGRDVCLSMLEWDRAHRSVGRFKTWTEDRLSTAALWWEWLVRRGREAGSSLGPDLYHEIRYEALVAHPADECAALCSFLGLPSDDTMPRFHEGRRKRDPGLSAKASWLPPTPGIRDWNTQMKPVDVEGFEAVVGDLLDDLDYPRAFAEPGPEALAHASRIRAAFTQDSRLKRRVGGAG